MDPVGYLQVQVFDSVSGQVDLLVTGVSIAQLSGDQTINKPNGELRGDIKVIHQKPREGYKTKNPGIRPGSF